VCPQPTADYIFRNRHDFSFAEKLYGTQPIVPPTCNSQTDKNGTSIFEDICLVNYQNNFSGIADRRKRRVPSLSSAGTFPSTKDHHLKSTCFCTHKMSLIPFNIRTSDSGFTGYKPLEHIVSRFVLSGRDRREGREFSLHLKTRVLSKCQVIFLCIHVIESVFKIPILTPGIELLKFDSLTSDAHRKITGISHRILILCAAKTHGLQEKFLSTNPEMMGAVSLRTRIWCQNGILGREPCTKPVFFKW